MIAKVGLELDRSAGPVDLNRPPVLRIRLEGDPPGQGSTYTPISFSCCTEVKNCSASTRLTNHRSRRLPSGDRYRATYLRSPRLVFKTSMLATYATPSPRLVSTPPRHAGRTANVYRPGTPVGRCADTAIDRSSRAADGAAQPISRGEVGRGKGNITGLTWSRCHLLPPLRRSEYLLARLQAFAPPHHIPPVRHSMYASLVHCPPAAASCRRPR